LLKPLNLKELDGERRAIFYRARRVTGGLERCGARQWYQALAEPDRFRIRFAIRYSTLEILQKNC
jgi:hypothetical protein